MFLTKHIILFSSLLCIVLSRHMDFRERFLERKRLRSLKDQRLKVLNKYILKNTEVLDDITHYRNRKINGKSLKAWMTAKAIEKDFRRLLAMDGMKYNYKRDLYWRTWRSIPPVNNATNQIVCYKCNHPIHVNTTECHNCGMWTIEEQPPPCPFEFFSVLSNEKMCGANYTQYKDVNNTCPSVIKFTDLTATCDNPIQTQWRFSKMYGVTKKYEEVICKNKDFCDILTLYEITPEHVVFRIINATNDVIYSRIMKPKLKNYICVHDCGRFNPSSRKVTKTDKPLKLDLLVPRDIKRPHILRRTNENVTKRAVLNEMIETVTKRELVNELNESAMKRILLNEFNESVTKRVVPKGVIESFTKRKHSNEMIKSFTKREYSNEMIESFTKREHSNEMNENVMKREPSNEMNDNVMKREPSNEMNENVMKRELSNEINENVMKREPSNEMNENVMKRESSNEMNENVMKREPSNEMNENVMKREPSNEMNENVVKREPTNEMNENVMKREPSNEMNENVVKREPTNEMNENVMKTKPSNEMNENVMKREPSNEMNQSVSKRGDFLSDINASVTKSGHNLHENIDSMIVPTEESEIKEVLNDILPAEEKMSESNDGGDGDKERRESDFIVVSIEENALHKGKSRKSKKAQSDLTTWGEDVSLKPTDTVDQTVQEAGHSFEEFEKEE